MGIAKFIESVKESLGLDEFKKSSKKKSIKNLLKKLNSKKEKITKLIKKDKKQKELQEELDIVNFQIKKGEKLLAKLVATKQGYIIKKRFKQKQISSFLKEVLFISNKGNLKIEKVEIEYIGEYLFNDTDIIENILFFKKRNSQGIEIDFLIPTTVNMCIYENLRSKNIEDSLEYFVQIIVNSMIFIYNRNNPKSYLFKYRSVGTEISDNIYKKDIYKVKFEIFGKLEYIYFDIKKF